MSIHDQLLAIGVKDSDGEPTSAIHMYNLATGSWEVISHMGTPRYNCIAAFFLVDNKLMVVGGYTGKCYDTQTDSIELAATDLELESVTTSPS